MPSRPSNLQNTSPSQTYPFNCFRHSYSLAGDIASTSMTNSLDAPSRLSKSVTTWTHCARTIFRSTFAQTSAWPPFNIGVITRQATNSPYRVGCLMSLIKPECSFLIVCILGFLRVLNHGILMYSNSLLTHLTVPLVNFRSQALDLARRPRSFSNPPGMHHRRAFVIIKCLQE